MSDDVGVQLLANSIVTGGVLIAIILALGPASGAHLNPVVTLANRVLGGLTNREAGGLCRRSGRGRCGGGGRSGQSA